MNQNQTNIPTESPKPKYPWLSEVIIIVLAVIVGIIGYNMVQKQNLIKNNTGLQPYPSVEQNPSAIKTTVDANNYFGFNIYKEIVKTAKTDNTFISPLSLSMALTMTANGANGQTLTEMQKVLGLTNVGLSQANLDNKNLLLSLQTATKPTEKASSLPGVVSPFSMPTQTGDKPTFNIANSLWADKNYSFLPDFSALIKSDYQGQSQTLDFKDSKSLGIINGWVSDKTNGKIPTILTALTSKLYLINAVYFKGSWANPFYSDNTKNSNFNLEGKTTKQVPMMNQSDSYNYYEGKNLQIVSLLYYGDEYAMQVFLPAKGTNIDSFVNNLTSESYVSYLAKQTYKEGEVQLPKFKIELGGDILDNLKAIGLVNSLSDEADFSKMSPDSLKIGQVIHKTFISVDEKGTEAAAATAIGMIDTAMPGNKPTPFVFTADHPFFFTVENSKTHEIIFMGTVKNP